MAYRRRHRPFQTHLVRLDRLDDVIGQWITVLFQCRCAYGIMTIPVEGDARRIQNAQCGFDHLWPDPVSRQQRYAMCHIFLYCLGD